MTEAARASALLPAIPRLNNMDALRLVFASVVIACHVYPLSLNPAFKVLSGWADGTWPVRGFFVLSGFLIFQSCENSRSLRSFAEKRVRRIYPAYFTVVIFWALVGALLTSGNLENYFGRDLLAYLANNLAFLNYRHPDLPGVFAHSPVAAVNGALWTIKIEVMFYISVPVLVWLMRRMSRIMLIGAIYLLSMLYFSYFDHLAGQGANPYYANLAKQLPGQMAYFISGAALYYYFTFFMRHRLVLIAAGCAGLFAGVYFNVQTLLPAAVAILVIAAAFGTYLGNWGRRGDFSYGIYIWHFPIIQLFVAVGLYAAHAWLAFLATVIVTVVAAFLSWHVVERPFLRRDSHYRVAERPSA